MSWYLISALILLPVAIVIAVLQRRKESVQSQADLLDERLNQEMLDALAQMQPPLESESPPVIVENAKGGMRLTETQLVALSSAYGNPIYAEGRYSPGPDHYEFYSPRTIDSLVKRGFLQADDLGGYIITEAGQVAMRRGYGY